MKFLWVMMTFFLISFSVTADGSGEDQGQVPSSQFVGESKEVVSQQFEVTVLNRHCLDVEFEEPQNICRLSLDLIREAIGASGDASILLKSNGRGLIVNISDNELLLQVDYFGSREQASKELAEGLPLLFEYFGRELD